MALSVGHTRWIQAPWLRTALLLGLSLLVLLPAGFLLERVLADRLVRARESDLRASLVNMVIETNGKIAVAESRVARLARLLEEAAVLADDRDAARFDAVTVRNPNGTVQRPRSTDFSVEAVLFVSAHHPLDRRWKGLLARAGGIIGQLGSGAVGAGVDDVFFITPYGAESIFIPGDTRYADRPDSDSLDTSEWIDPVRLENNPTRGLRWLSAQHSSRPPIWYPAIVAPVFRGDTLLGVAGFDLSIGGLFDQSDRPAGGTEAAQIVVDMGKGGLITHGVGAEFGRATTDSFTIEALQSPLRDSLSALLARAGSAAPGEVTRGSAGSRTLIAVRMARPDWSVVTLIERAAIVAPLRAPLRVMRMTLALVLAALMLAILWLERADRARIRAIEAGRHSEFLAALNETTLDLLDRRDLSDLVQALMGRLVALLEAPHVEVLLVEGDTLVIRAFRNSGNAFLGMRVSRDEAPLSWRALDSGQTVTVDDYSAMPHRPNHYDALGPCAVMELPILRGVERLGVISLARTEVGRPFTEADVHHGELLARQVALVLHNAAIYGEAIQEAELRSADLRQSEARLQRAMKMESIGRLAGGVAHDFNNMLGVILGHTELALERVAPSEPIHAHLTEVRKAAVRSADLTRQLLAFASQQTVAPKVIDLNTTVTGMLTMLKRLIGEDVNVTWEPAPDLWPVRMDPSQMDQILTNLCVNARDAITNVGSVAIRSANVVIDPAFCAVNAAAVPGEYVRVSVQDTGAGMDEATMARIFEPFFSTKRPGVGTGLGLSTAYGAVTQNNGFITVSSELGRGSVFAVHLPRHAGIVGPAPAAPVVVAPSPGTGTILVVEDEPAILSLLAKGLAAHGYHVLTAAGPAQAIRIADLHASTIHLLLTDVIMPEMNGRDLAATLSASRPDIRVLYMSGYTADAIAHHGVLDEAVHFIGKPFTPSELAIVVRSVLGAH